MTVRVAAGLGALLLLVTACGAGPRGRDATAPTSSVTAGVTVAPPSRPTTTVAVPAKPTTTVPATTTTVVPVDPQPTPDAASGALIQAWENGDRAAADAVATPAATGELFAEPYRGEILNDRGCGAPGPNPVQCTWGPYADAASTSTTYDITLQTRRSAWYVTAVSKLG